MSFIAGKSASPYYSFAKAVRVSMVPSWTYQDGVQVLTAAAGYRMIATDLIRSLERTAKQPNVARETAYYLANIGKVKSVEDFLADHRLFAFAMKAAGLGEMTYAKAFMRKVLTEGMDHPQSFANRLTDPRYREFAQSFNFARYGPATTSFKRAQQDIADGYIRQVLEENAGLQNEGTRLALYFQRKAPELTSVYGILADRALLTVVQTALGLPPIISAADIDRQAQTIADRLDLRDLKEPAKLRKFLSRFLGLWEAASPGPPQVSNSLLIGPPSSVVISPGLLVTLQNLRPGGRW